MNPKYYKISPLTVKTDEIEIVEIPIGELDYDSGCKPCIFINDLNENGDCKMWPNNKMCISDSLKKNTVWKFKRKPRRTLNE